MSTPNTQREMTGKLDAPKTWGAPSQHFHAGISHDWYKMVFALTNTFVNATAEFYRQNGYAATLMPITCESISSPMGLGSDSLPVHINLFGRPTYLADSMQFQLEYLLRLHDKGVWYLMPTFRGEEPDARHLNQFFHSEAEIRGGLSDVMTLVEDYCVFLANRILEEHEDNLMTWVGDVSHIRKMTLLKGNFPRITFEEARELLGKNAEYYDQPSEGVMTVSRKGEEKLMEHFGGIVWVTHFQSKAVPFYQATTEDGRHATCADLLMGIGEVVGCGERHTTKDSVLNALKLHSVASRDYQWYIDMKEHYPMQTSGFGMGMERFLLWITKHNDIRDMHIMPRLKHDTYLP